MRGQGCTKLCCDFIKKILQKFKNFVRTVPVTVTRAPAPGGGGARAGRRAQADAHAQARDLFPAGRFGLCVSNRPARQLARAFVGLGNLGFVFRLAHYGQACVTIWQSRSKSGTSRERLGKLSNCHACFSSGQNGGGKRGPPRASAICITYIIHIYLIIRKLQTTT